MKKYEILAVLIFLAGTLYSEDAIEKNITNYEAMPQNTFYVSPINFTFKNLQIGYERNLKKGNSLLLRASIGYDSYNDSYLPEYEYSYKEMVVTTELSYRKYIIYSKFNELKNLDKNKSKSNFWGLYISPFLAYQYAEGNNISLSIDYFTNEFVDRSSKYHQNAIVGGLYLGSRFDLVKGRITLDVYAGVGMKYNNIVSSATGSYFDGGIYNIGVTGIVPRGNIDFGFNF